MVGSLAIADQLTLAGAGFSAVDVPTPAGRVRLYKAGQGPALLLLHGIGGGASSYYWRRLAPLLQEQFTLFAPDSVGWGESEHPARFLLFHDYFTQIRALLDHIGPVRAIVAQGLAAGFTIKALEGRAPGAVDRLALLAPTGGKDFGTDAFYPVIRYTLSILARIPGVNVRLYRRFFHRRRAYEFWFRERGFVDPTRVPEDLIDAGLYSGTRPNAAYAALPFVSGALRYDIAPLLAGVDRPALMLWGSKEIQIAPAVRGRLATLNPARIRAETVPDTRSNFENEAPEQTAALLRAFLEEPA